MAAQHPWHCQVLRTAGFGPRRPRWTQWGQGSSSSLPKSTTTTNTPANTLTLTLERVGRQQGTQVLHQWSQSIEGMHKDHKPTYLVTLRRHRGLVVEVEGDLNRTLPPSTHAHRRRCSAIHCLTPVILIPIIPTTTGASTQTSNRCSKQVSTVGERKKRCSVSRIPASCERLPGGPPGGGP